MRAFSVTIVAAMAATFAGCHHNPGATSATGAAPRAGEAGTLAQVIYWRAKPGKFDEYSRYVRDVAEPIDHDAQRRGAFLSITTYTTRDTASAWTHMRVFILRDSAQLQALGEALESAGRRFEPDSAKRAVRGVYAATLRDRVGTFTAELLP